MTKNNKQKYLLKIEMEISSATAGSFLPQPFQSRLLQIIHTKNEDKISQNGEHKTQTLLQLLQRVRREIYIQGASPTTHITDNFNKKDKRKRQTHFTSYEKFLLITEKLPPKMLVEIEHNSQIHYKQSQFFLTMLTTINA